MKERPDETVGVLVIRVWVEDTSPEGLRARITSTLDVTSNETGVTGAASVDEICAIVRGWLKVFLQEPRPHDATPH